jgi:polysaccharide chain length determinant protein (PEP-CTERM system associated)
MGTSGQSYVGQMGIVSEQIKDTRLELRVAEQTRDGIRQQLEEQTQRGPGAISKRAATIKVPEIDSRINGLKQQLDELMRKYTEQHPDVVSIRRLLAQLEDDRKREIEVRTKAAENEPGNALSGDPVAQQLKIALNDSEANVTTVRARLGEYEARYNQLRSSAETLPKIDVEFTQLNRDYDMQRRQYDALVMKRETATMTGKLEDAGVAEFRIIDPPRVTPKPVAPNRPLLLGGVVAVSLLAGLAMSWLVSQVRPTFHDGRSLREIAQRPLLGMVSALPTHGLRVMRRRAALLFAGGVSGLVASYGAALAFLFLAAARGS